MNQEPSPKPSASGLPLAMAAFPLQPWEEPSDTSHALKAGTIFPCLELPFYVTGGECHG